jgi:hypothetical protein
MPLISIRAFPLQSEHRYERAMVVNGPSSARRPPSLMKRRDAKTDSAEERGPAARQEISIDLLFFVST